MNLGKSISKANRRSIAAYLGAVLLVGASAPTIAYAASRSTSVEVETQPLYRGYSVPGTSTNTTWPQLRISQWESTDVMDPKSSMAFCFNRSKYVPYAFDSRRAPLQYFKTVNRGSDVMSKLATRPRAGLSPKDLEKAIVKVVYNGAEYNASGLKEKYQLNDQDFYTITQEAVWYYTEEGTGNPGNSIKLANRNNLYPAYYELIGDPQGLLQANQKTPLKDAPNDATLEVFVADNPEYQNLLSVKLVDRETGKEIPTPPKPVNPTVKAPVIGTVVSVNGYNSSHSLPVILTPEDMANGVNVIDHIVFKNLEPKAWYKVTGKLVEANNPANVIAIKELPAQQIESADGAISVDFGKITNIKPGNAYVAFEYLQKVNETDKTTAVGEVLKHEDANDKAQTFVAPSAPAETPAEPVAPLAPTPNEPTEEQPKTEDSKETPDEVAETPDEVAETPASPSTHETESSQPSTPVSNSDKNEANPRTNLANTGARGQIAAIALIMAAAGATIVAFTSRKSRN